MKLSPLLLLLCSMLLSSCTHAQSWNDWHYHADIAVMPQADDTFGAVYADFTHLLKSTFGQTGTLDENSIRIVPLQEVNPTAPVAYRFEKVTDYNAATRAAGTLIFWMPGVKDSSAITYRVYFDITTNGVKPVFHNTMEVPQTANMVWNGGFEILSSDYHGANRYANAGTNMPRGWWGGNIARILENKANSAHSGQRAIGFTSPQSGKVISITAAPSAPGIRVQPRENYLFSFWIKGENLSGKNSTIASIQWRDKNNKTIGRVFVPTGIGNTATYDWTQIRSYLVAPDDAVTAVMPISTRSETGVLMVDDITIRAAVPPLLGGE